MERFDSPLKNLKVASPCSADWEAMEGDSRKRFCGDCRLHVYNLSGMTSYDAENLLRLSEGRLCVRYFQRADGTILTQDCPVGWALVKRRLSTMAAAAAGLLMSLIGTFAILSYFARKPVVGRVIPIPFSTPTPTPPVLMGAIAMPSPKPSASATPTKKLREFLGEVAPPSEELRQEVLRAAGA